MAETKSKKANDKLFDVAKPGKSAPSSTSRPVIITNRPVLKDPMVIRVDTGDDEDNAATSADASTEMKHKVDIKPLHIDLESVLAPSAPEVKKTSKKAAAKTADEQPAPDDAPAAEETPADTPPEPETAKEAESTPDVETQAEKAPATEATPTAPAESAKPAETVQRVREKVIAPPSAASDAKTADEQPAPDDAPAAEETPADTPPEPETEEAADSIGDSEPSLDNSDTPVLSEKETKAAEAAKQKAEEQEKIIASGQFYLPINAVSKRRTKRNIFIGTFLVIVLIVAAALAAWDANLFSIPGFQAPTNFL